jgi:hypothetical protein
VEKSRRVSSRVASRGTPARGRVCVYRAALTCARDTSCGDRCLALARKGLSKGALGGKAARSLESDTRRACACFFFFSLPHTCAARGTRCARVTPTAAVVGLLPREGLSKGARRGKPRTQSRVASRGAPARGCSCVSRGVHTCARDSSSRGRCYWSSRSGALTTRTLRERPLGLSDDGVVKMTPDPRQVRWRV